MPLVPESERERRLKCEAYSKISESRIAEHKAAERHPLKEIHNIARSLLYPTASNVQLTQNARGADDRSDSEYEPDVEEEAHFVEETLREEEEAALAMSKAMCGHCITQRRPYEHQDW